MGKENSTPPQGGGKWKVILGIIVAVVVIAVVVMSASGGLFQGKIFSFPKPVKIAPVVIDTVTPLSVVAPVVIDTVTPLEVVETTRTAASLKVATEIAVDEVPDLSGINLAPLGLTVEVQVASAPADAKFYYLDRTGGGILEDFIYESVEGVDSKDVLNIFALRNDGGEYFELVGAGVNTGAPSFSSCPTIRSYSRYSDCNVVNWPIGAGSQMFRLNKNPDGSTYQTWIIADDSGERGDRDGMFVGNEVINPILTRVYPGETKIFAIIANTEWINEKNDDGDYIYADGKHISGSVFVLLDSLELVDSDGKSVKATMDNANTVAAQSVYFR